MYMPTTLHVCIYLKLPQTTVAMLNGNIVTNNLTTWHSAADLSTLTIKKIHTQILEPCLQDGPIALCLTDFNLGNVNIDISNMQVEPCQELETWLQADMHIYFYATVPRLQQPASHCPQAHSPKFTGPNGQPVTVPNIKYYQCMMNTVRPFETQQRYSISICDRLIQGLDKTLLPSFQQLYPNHSTVHNLGGSYQCRTLPTIFAAVQAVEDDRN
jgi:hypothetical protein